MSVDVEEKITEKQALDNAFSRLELALRKYASNAEEQAHTHAKMTSGSEIENLKDEVRNLENKIAESREEISHMSMELVRLKEENKRLKENSGRIEELLERSIRNIEEFVS